MLPSTEDVKIKEEEPKSTLTPPASEEAGKNGDSSSELSELDMEQEDIGEIEPAYYYEGGKVPVFTPVRGPLRSSSELEKLLYNRSNLAHGWLILM